MVVVQALDRLGVLRGARQDDMTDLPELTEVLRQLIPDATARSELGQRAAALVDGRGAQRVALSLLGSELHLRPAVLGDARLLHAWRNHPMVRAASATQDPITFESHERWIRAVLAHSSRWLFVGLVGRLPVGSIRFDRLDSGHLEVSLYLDPDLQGLGLGRHLLAAGECALLRLYSAGVTVEASAAKGCPITEKAVTAASTFRASLRSAAAVSGCRERVCSDRFSNLLVYFISFPSGPCFRTDY